MAPAGTAERSHLLTLEEHAELCENFIRIALRLIFSSIDNLESLVIEDPCFLFPFADVLNVDGIRRPQHWLIHSLKRIRIDPADETEDHLSTQQALWLIVFTQVEQAILSFRMLKEEAAFLDFHCSNIQGLSKVKELALRIYLPPSETHDRKGLNEMAIGGFIVVTSQLKSLEVQIVSGIVSLAWPPALRFSRKPSFKTLREFRIIDVYPRAHRIPNLDYSILSNLVKLSINWQSLDILFKEEDFKLPESLQVIEIPFYYFNDFDEGEEGEEMLEDFHLSSILENRHLPNLREVDVPFGPFDMNMTEPKSQRNRDSWKANRIILESNPIFKNNKVKLTLSKPGDKG